MIETVLLIVLFLLGWGLTGRLAAARRFVQILDHPNARSLHAESRPRSGGIAVFLVIGLAFAGARLLYPLPPGSPWMFVGLGAVALVAFLDDLRGVGPGWRLLVQGLAGLCLVFAGRGLGIQVTPLAVAVVVPVVIWSVNVYNFMDGMDGLAGTMAVIGFAVLALLGWAAGNALFAFTAMAVAAAAAGFLVVNFPPARIFLGDTGSYTLGYLAASFGLWGIVEGIFSAWVPILIFSLFIADSGFTLLRRARAGECLWQAHRSHGYQRLVRAGWSHRRTLGAATLLMLASAGSALWATAQGTGMQITLLGIWTVAYTVLLRVIDQVEAGKRSRPLP